MSIPKMLVHSSLIGLECFGRWLERPDGRFDQDMQGIKKGEKRAYGKDEVNCTSIMKFGDHTLLDCRLLSFVADEVLKLGLVALGEVLQILH